MLTFECIQNRANTALYQICIKSEVKNALLHFTLSHVLTDLDTSFSAYNDILVHSKHTQMLSHPVHAVLCPMIGSAMLQWQELIFYTNFGLMD